MMHWKLKLSWALNIAPVAIGVGLATWYGNPLPVAIAALLGVPLYEISRWLRNDFYRSKEGKE